MTCAILAAFFFGAAFGVMISAWLALKLCGDQTFTESWTKTEPPPSDRLHTLSSKQSCTCHLKESQASG